METDAKVIEERERPPLCGLHKSLEQRGWLVVEVSANNCIACALNERKELLDLLAPVANPDGSEDSVAVLTRLREEKQSWRCFHCKEVFTTEVFTTEESAAEHFGNGDYEDEPPLCIEAATAEKRELVKQNRKFWLRIQEADSEIVELDGYGQRLRLDATTPSDTDWPNSLHNAAFIAKCEPQTILALIERVRELENALHADDMTDAANEFLSRYNISLGHPLMSELNEFIHWYAAKWERSEVQ